MIDLHRVGGTSMLLRHLVQLGILDGNCITVTGNTLEANLASAPDFPAKNELVAPAGSPWKPYADLQICFGNVAPDGIVFKVSALEAPQFDGTAICFDSAKEVLDAAVSNLIRPGHVVVLRGLGPVAAGMPEIHVASSALSVPELKGKVALISDTRVSGVSSGAIGVHCAPEAAVGGPIGKLRDGDPVSFNLIDGTIHADVDFSARGPMAVRSDSQPGYLADFAALVTQANHGCVSRTAKRTQ